MYPPGACLVARRSVLEVAESVGELKSLKPHRGEPGDPSGVGRLPGSIRRNRRIRVLLQLPRGDCAEGGATLSFPASFSASFLHSCSPGRRGHPPDVVQPLREGVDSIDHSRQHRVPLCCRLRSSGGGAWWRGHPFVRPRTHSRCLEFFRQPGSRGRSRLPGCSQAAK